MKLFSRWWPRDRTLDDFADAIRGELSEVSPHAPGAGLLDRIRASRRSGVRIILPVNEPHRSGRLLLVASAVAAAALTMLLIGRVTRDSGVSSTTYGAGWYAGDVAFANAPQVTNYSPAQVTRADRLEPRALRYSRTERDGSGVIRTAESSFTLTRDQSDGDAMWRVVVSRGRFDGSRQIDSLWVTARTLTPIRQTIVSIPYRAYERLTVWQRFRGDRVSGEMKAMKNGEVSAHRTFDRTLSAAHGPYVPDAMSPFFLGGVALERDWRGSVSVLGWLVRDDDISTTLNLHIDGDETVTVPAGTFLCWRMVVEYAGGVQTQWVRKRDGVAVKLLESSAARTRREVVLASE